MGANGVAAVARVVYDARREASKVTAENLAVYMVAACVACEWCRELGCLMLIYDPDRMMDSSAILRNLVKDVYVCIYVELIGGYLWEEIVYGREVSKSKMEQEKRGDKDRQQRVFFQKTPASIEAKGQKKGRLSFKLGPCNVFLCLAATSSLSMHPKETRQKEISGCKREGRRREESTCLGLTAIKNVFRQDPSLLKGQLAGVASKASKARKAVVSNKKRRKREFSAVWEVPTTSYARLLACFA